MSSIIGPVTPVKIALALGAVGVGAIVGGTVAHKRDSNVFAGAAIGGGTVAGVLALALGGIKAWERFRTPQAGATGAAAGISELLKPATTVHAPRITPAAAQPVRAPLPSAVELFRPTAAAVTSTVHNVPAFAATPRLPLPQPTGALFTQTLQRFLT